jgi:quinone-modifying oxidoreductase subunit QmoC
MKITPNIEFIRRIKKESGSDLKTCMQCGNCTVVCNLSPEGNPFPRKEMIWAAWGQKEKLVTDPDIWLCHQCGDCTTTCPRGVKPGDVLASLRSQAIEHYANPSFLARWLKKPTLLPLVIAIPIVIIHLIILAAGTLTNTVDPVNYSEFFPHAWINSSFSALAVLMALGLILSVASFWKGMKKHSNESSLRGKNDRSNLNNEDGVPRFARLSVDKAGNDGIIKTIWQVKKELLSHKNFNDCETNKFRQVAHALVFYGFISLLLVTIAAIVAVILEAYPLGLWHPVKILGNLAGLAMVIGLVMMIVQRLRKNDAVSKSSFFDWSFLISILLLVLTGFVTEFSRFANAHLGYYWYLFHLIIMWYVILYLPYTKFGHVVYRFAALVFVKQSGRK